MLSLQDQHVRLLGKGETETDRGAGGAGCSAAAAGQRPPTCFPTLFPLCGVKPNTLLQDADHLTFIVIVHQNYKLEHFVALQNRLTVPSQNT